MPYANPARQSASVAKFLRKKYKTDPKFRDAESKRKADWYERKKASDPNFAVVMAAKRAARYAAERTKKAA